MGDLRPYQRELVDRVEESVAGGHSPICCAPCGAGKTYIMRELAEHHRDKQILIVAHRRELLRQTAEVLAGLDNVRLESIFTEARHLGERGQPDLIICDEAHLSGAKSYTDTFQHYGVPVIGFTATPCRLDGKPLTAYNDLIQGLSADDLIRDGYLAPYRLYAPELYDVSRLQVRAGDYAAEDLDSILRNSALYGDVIAHYKRLADGQQAIAYCATVKQSEEIVQAFCEAGISARHIDGTTPDRERQEALDAFRRGEYRILSNVNLISEGISIPECSVVLGLRPTMSRALFIQQMSRALRWADGKQATLIDYVGNVHRHGMPSAAYTYSLDGKVKSREFDSEGNYFVRTCSACYGTYESRLDTCPWCGTPYQPTARELAKHEEIELAEIKADEAAREQERLKKLRQDIRQARSYEDFRRIARENGYNPVWARIRAKQRGYIR